LATHLPAQLYTVQLPCFKTKKNRKSFKEKERRNPNPAANELFIDAIDYDQVDLKLYNMMGSLVLDKTVIGSNSIDINNLSNGVYIYKVYANSTELKVGKLIISK
jgi:hypothetical protein